VKIARFDVLASTPIVSAPIRATAAAKVIPPLRSREELDFWLKHLITPQATHLTPVATVPLGQISCGVLSVEFTKLSMLLT
jgi:hypothetical protein